MEETAKGTESHSLVSKTVSLKPTKQAREMARLVGCLQYESEDQSSILTTHMQRLGMMVCACKLSTGKVKLGESLELIDPA